MPFPEQLKKDVRKRAAFRCCRCQSIGVHIHHIIPESLGGLDTIDNAAPLCEKCHSDFGGNPEKRKQIRELRDWWYEIASTMFKLELDYPAITEQIDMLISMTQQNTAEIDKVKAALKDYANKMIDSITPESLQTTASGIVNVLSRSFVAGSPCQMSGQTCPACGRGIMDVDGIENGVVCNVCGLYISY